jgi:hypothetical protein
MIEFVVRVGFLSDEVSAETRKLLRLLNHASGIFIHQDDLKVLVFDVAPKSGIPSSAVWAESTAEVFRENGLNAVAVPTQPT